MQKIRNFETLSYLVKLHLWWSWTRSTQLKEGRTWPHQMLQDPTFAPDEETRAATETLEALQGQQRTAGLSENSSLLTPPGEADYFEGEGLMETVRQSHREQKVCCAPVSQQSVQDTLAGLITTISVGIIPPARVVAEDLTKANLREGSPNTLLTASSGVGKQVTSEPMDSCSASSLGAKNNQQSSSKPRTSTLHSSEPGPSGGAAGGSSQDPNEPRQEFSHLAMYISDEDEFADDPHQIIPIEDAFALPDLPRQNLEGFDHGYILPAEVTEFQGTYYHESGDVRPGYNGVSPWDYRLNHQGHVALKLHSSIAAYSSYIAVV